MATKQGIEKSELKEEIVKLKNENKRYLKQLQDGILSETIVSSCISANNRQIDSKNRQIEAIIKNQGKITALPIC